MSDKWDKFTNLLEDGDIKVFANHLGVVQRPVERSSGYRGIHDVVLSQEAVVMLYIDEKDQVYLVEQERTPANGRVTELPAETLNKPGMTPLQVMLEGMEEECGMRISPNQVEYKGWVWSTPGHDTEKVHLFKGQGTYERVPRRLEDSEEGLVVKVVPFLEAYNLVMDNTIHDPRARDLIQGEYSLRVKTEQGKLMSLLDNLDQNVQNQYEEIMAGIQKLKQSPYLRGI